MAELIRQNIPFAVLVPLPLLNEIDWISKTEVDPIVRERRQKMKLIVSSSLGQAWLINHPKCRLDNDQHVVYFTQCASNTELERVSSEIFSSWYAHDILSADAAVLPRTMAHSQDIDVLALSAIISLLEDGASKKPRKRNKSVKTPTSATTAQTPSVQFVARAHRAARRQQPAESIVSEGDTTLPLSAPEKPCVRALTGPTHTISTALPPKPINQWLVLQDAEDIPKDMPRISPDEIRKGLPKDLIVLRDSKGRQRILVPACQWVALTKTEHETMIHIKGNRVPYGTLRSK